MNNLSTSFLLLAVALVLLYLAVTNRLSRVLDAWDVVTGKATVSGGATTVAAGTPLVSLPNIGQVTLQLPSLPTLGHTNTVGIA